MHPVDCVLLPALIGNWVGTGTGSEFYIQGQSSGKMRGVGIRETFLHFSLLIRCIPSLTSSDFIRDLIFLVVFLSCQIVQIDLRNSSVINSFLQSFDLMTVFLIRSAAFCQV